MGFFDTVKGQYKKGAKMVDDYQKGAAQRDKDATERFREKTRLLKEKAKVKNEYVKAKADYTKAKGGGQSMFSGGNSMFGEGKDASFGGSIGMASNKPASMTSQGWGIGGSMAQDKPMKAVKSHKKAGKKKKSSKGIKKVVYYR